ncbi:hypothetical protein (nucleomorph) [Guillardia theta]|uniref:Uncharacterized protein n=1 Tax=Guillardia theta TaxID=55529 RepID=Q98RY1_GUITH|nr:hypothetical protein GTHECHR1027 [Guillardia theta]AAK39819.1 hypothetical protein [Guillardia theta]|mmetsp:Transcript_16969/g.56197  ORF Transcript_16969/g.56197 Transcript_16969/m.56197 type:complete len:226 (-) Transcript_16969:1419-2096(-)
MIYKIGLIKEFCIKYKYRSEIFLTTIKTLKTLKKFLGGNFLNYQQYNRDIKVRNKYNTWCEHKSIASFFELNVNNHQFFNALYFFNKIPQSIFRVRIYKIESNFLCIDLFTSLVMKIYKYNVEKIILNNTRMYNKSYLIENCDIFWFGKLKLERNEIFFVGKMYKDGCTLYSNFANNFIIVKDELIISKRFLQINDRGFDFLGNYLYGSSDNISYEMKHLRRIVL